MRDLMTEEEESDVRTEAKGEKMVSFEEGVSEGMQKAS